MYNIYIYREITLTSTQAKLTTMEVSKSHILNESNYFLKAQIVSDIKAIYHHGIKSNYSFTYLIYANIITTYRYMQILVIILLYIDLLIPRLS